MSKKNLPTSIRKACWNLNIGCNVAQSKCYMGCGENISKTNFECGHIISKKNGGSDNLRNLKPLCSHCNRSMGVTNFESFVSEYGLTPVIYSENCSNENIKKIKKRNCVKKRKIKKIKSNVDILNNTFNIMTNMEIEMLAIFLLSCDTLDEIMTNKKRCSEYGCGLGYKSDGYAKYNNDNYYYTLKNIILEHISINKCDTSISHNIQNVWYKSVGEELKKKFIYDSDKNIFLRFNKNFILLLCKYAHVTDVKINMTKQCLFNKLFKEQYIDATTDG